MKPAHDGFDVEADMRQGLPVYEASAQIKLGFIRKVYMLLSIQLIFTVIVSAVFMYHGPTHETVLHSPNMMMTASLLPFGFLFALFCYKDKHPINLLLLAGFTMAISYTVGVVCAMYNEMGLDKIVLQALILTSAVFVSLTTYTMVTKKDFSFLGQGLFAALVILIVWGFLQSFFDFGLGGRMVFSLVGALIFCGYILYDTSVIIHHLGPDDYIMAVVNLYLDIVNLFLYLLEILRMLQGGDN